jgi:hypothetical protein
MTAIVVAAMSMDNGHFGPNNVQESTLVSGQASSADSLRYEKTVSLVGRNSDGGSVNVAFAFDATSTDYVWPERSFWRVTVEALEEGDL